MNHIAGSGSVVGLLLQLPRRLAFPDRSDTVRRVACDTKKQVETFQAHPKTHIEVENSLGIALNVARHQQVRPDQKNVGHMD